MIIISFLLQYLLSIAKFILFSYLTVSDSYCYYFNKAAIFSFNILWKSTRNREASLQSSILYEVEIESAPDLCLLGWSVRAIRSPGNVNRSCFAFLCLDMNDDSWGVRHNVALGKHSWLLYNEDNWILAGVTALPELEIIVF